MIIFHFNIVNLKNENLYVDLSRVYKNCIYLQEISNITKWVASEWSIELFLFQVNGILKILVYYQIMHAIIIIHKTSSVKIGLNTKLALLGPNLLFA
jgi:hypothetical protein